MLCKVCGEDKERILKEKYRGYFIYVDAEGNRWYGKRCPPCYQAYKLAYDAKRRLAAGHVPLGTEVPCNVCGESMPLSNGGSRLCPKCIKP